MRETKVQKIARLENKIEEQKKEMTEIKKDRKRLNYAVERLERKIQKLSAQSSKDDAAKIKELENKMQSYKEFVPKHNKTVLILKELARRYKILRDSPEMSDKDFNMKRLSYFMGGFYEDIDGFPLFDFDTLITRVNILNGGWISEEISRKIKERLENSETYKETLKRCEPYIEAAKNYDKEASDFIIMEVWKLLREYSDIFIDDWFDATHCIPDETFINTAKEHRF